RATASEFARDPLQPRAASAEPNRLLVYKKRAPPAREDRRGVSRGDRKCLRKLYGRHPEATTSYFGWHASIFPTVEYSKSIITAAPSPELAAAPPFAIPEISTPTTP